MPRFYSCYVPVCQIYCSPEFFTEAVVIDFKKRNHVVYRQSGTPPQSNTIVQCAIKVSKASMHPSTIICTTEIQAVVMPDVRTYGAFSRLGKCLNCSEGKPVTSWKVCSTFGWSVWLMAVSFQELSESYALMFPLLPLTWLRQLLSGRGCKADGIYNNFVATILSFNLSQGIL